MFRMRAVIFCAVAGLVLPSLAVAQSSARHDRSPGTNGGFLAGLGSTSFVPSNVAPATISPLKRGAIGAFVERSAGAITFEVGAFISFKGALLNTTESPVKVRASYLEIPVLGRLNVLPRRMKHPYFFAGVVPAMLIKDNLGEFTSGWDFGVCGGAGFEWDRVVANVRYTRGIKSLGIEINGQSLSNRALMVMFGLLVHR